MKIRFVFQWHGAGTFEQRRIEFIGIVGRALRRGFRDSRAEFAVPRHGRNQKRVYYIETGDSVLSAYQYPIWINRGSKGSYLQMPIEVTGCLECVPDFLHEEYLASVFRFLTFGRLRRSNYPNVWLETFMVNSCYRITLPKDLYAPLDITYNEFKEAAYQS